MTQFIELSQYTLIRVEGDDAESYLQGQLTADVTALAAGDSTFTAHCDPKGKMSAVFRLIRLSEKRFYALIRTCLLPAALDQLKKYAVFSKVAFTQEEAEPVGIIGETELPVQAKFNNRAILINPQSAVAFNADSALWDLADIQQGYPILTEQSQFEFIPQALNLQAIEQAVSFHKGCYIGQETVARAKYRGANKRAMYVFKAATDSIPECGGEIEMQLESGWRKTGTILYALHADGELWLQVVLNRFEDNPAFRLAKNQLPLELQPLPYDLDA
ncbi:folate-binding protein YgfZ [Actinobacillus succinogenes]|uniref:Aminomethyltransferase n=1 Tax=Actinobacillus succinogenes (strain ATCC 55618 / DSM 22257 / CCUG 43843 / 130Z) TaxID=339671 RepID=A6VLE9_ACTSZ|nr:folate-binding protein YgfZ [Actinobacillus succinogenes]ABR73796.1 aminomethyltransferase [Actinobacillus succinogenes 130Z]PHI39748.1 folate-binding protein YgfZ [Actinobacillus succinogenes]